MNGHDASEQLAAPGRPRSIDREQLAAVGRLESINSEQPAAPGRLRSIDREQLAAVGRLESINSEQPAVSGMSSVEAAGCSVAGWPEGVPKGYGPGTSATEQWACREAKPANSTSRFRPACVDTNRSRHLRAVTSRAAEPCAGDAIFRQRLCCACWHRSLRPRSSMSGDEKVPHSPLTC
jgi:hypothetical protein